MFKGSIGTPTAITANTNIPFNVVWNTNNNTRYNSTDNTISILSSGYYDVTLMVTVTGITDGSTTLQLFADGVAIPEALSVMELTPSTGTDTINLTDTIRVTPTDLPNFASLSARITDDGTINNAVIVIEKRK